MSSSRTYRVTRDQIYHNNLPEPVGYYHALMLISDNPNVKPISFASGGKRAFDRRADGSTYNTKISMFRSTGDKQGRKDLEALNLIDASTYVTIIAYSR